MANVNFQIPDNKVAEYIDAFCDTYNYTENKNEGETKAQFAKRKVAEYMQEVYKGWKIQQRLIVAKQEDVNDTINIT